MPAPNTTVQASQASGGNGILNRAGKAIGVPGWVLIALVVATIGVVAYAVWRAMKPQDDVAAASATAAVVTSMSDECAFRGRFLGDDNKCHLPCQATSNDDGTPRERRCWIQPLGPSTPGVCVSKAYAARSGFECRDSPPIPMPRNGFARSVSSVPLVPTPDIPDESVCGGRTWAVIPDGNGGGCCDAGFLWNKQVNMCCENANTSKNARCKKSAKEYVGAPGALGPGWTWLGVKGEGPSAIHTWRSWEGIEMERGVAGKNRITKAVYCYDYSNGKKVKTVGRACDNNLRSSSLDCGSSMYLSFGSDKKPVCAPCPATPGANWGWGYGLDDKGKTRCTPPPKTPTPPTPVPAVVKTPPAPAPAVVKTPPAPVPTTPTPAPTPETFAAHAYDGLA